MFYALTAALMVSSMALAQVRYEYESPEKADAPQAKVMKQNGLKPGVRVQTSGKASLLPPPTGTADDIIYEPEGQKVSNLMRSDLSYENFMGQPQLYETDAYISDYGIGDDGSIYFQPISTYQTGGYIKLDKQADGTYVAHTPQVFYDQANDDGTHILAWATRMVLKTTP